MILSYDTIISMFWLENINFKLLNICMEVSRFIGQYESLMSPVPDQAQIVDNNIKFVHSNLALSSISISPNQIAKLYSNKQHKLSFEKLSMLNNFIKANNLMAEFNPYNVTSLQNAHKILFKGATSAGLILSDKKIFEIKNLFTSINSESLISPLISSSLLHYNLMHLKPFKTGNDMLARLWQKTCLVKYNTIFKYAPLFMKTQQNAYFQAFEESIDKNNVNIFLEYILTEIVNSVEYFIKQFRPEKHSAETRLTLASSHFKSAQFNRKEYISFFKTLSTATASRDLNYGALKKILKKSGDKALTKYNFV